MTTGLFKETGKIQPRNIFLSGGYNIPPNKVKTIERLHRKFTSAQNHIFFSSSALDKVNN
jgi:hypothetical protein